MKTSTSKKGASLGASLSLLLLASCSAQVEPLTDAQLNDAAATELAQMFAPSELIQRPLSLDDTIRRAVVNNLDNRLLRLEQSFALAQVDIDSMEMLPTLAANAGYTNRSRQNFTTSQVRGEPAPSGVFSRSSDASNTTSGLSTTWNVLDFTLGYYNARQAGNRALIAEERARRAGMDIIRDARESYWKAYAAQQLAGTIADTIMEANSVLARIREGEQKGAIPAVEALRSRRTVLENVRQLEIFSNQLATARIELAQLVNARPGSPFTLATSQMSIPSLPGTLTELEARAFTSSPSLREQQYRINIALDDVRRTTAQLFPELTFSAEANFDDNSFLLNNNWSQFGLNVGWNLLRLITAPQRVNLSEHGVEVERARALAVRMAVLAQTHIAYRDFHFAREQFRRASELAEIDQQLAQQSRAREEAAVGSQVERVVVETSALISQLRVYDAYGELVAAYSAVLSTIGADDDLRLILEEIQQDRQKTVEERQVAENKIALEGANIKKLTREDVHLQRGPARAMRRLDRAWLDRDGAPVQREEVQSLAKAAHLDGMPEARSATLPANAESFLARRQTELAAEKKNMNSLTQEMAARAVAHHAALERLALAQTAQQTAAKRASQPRAP